MTDPKDLRDLLTEYSKFKFFPFGTYLLSKDGLLLACNEAGRTILNLPGEGEAQKTQARLLSANRHVEQCMDKISQQIAAGNENTGQRCTVSLIIDREEKILDNYLTAVKNSQQQFIGYLGFFFDITEQARNKELFEKLPAGLYRVDQDEILIRVNQAVVKMLGYESDSDLIGRKVTDFYARAGDADEIRRKLSETGSISNYKVELAKENDETIFVLLSAFECKTSTGETVGREGTIIDITGEERDRQIVDHVPIGLYEIRIENGQDIIRRCNHQFAKIHDFPDENALIGFDIKKLYASEAEYNRFIEHINENDRQNKSLHRYELNARTCNGKKIRLEIHSRLIKDTEGNIIGRTGAVQDITEEKELENQVKVLTDDIGGVLHAYTSTLLMIQHSITPVIQSLDPKEFDLEKYLSPAKEEETLAQPVKQLSASLKRLLDFAQAHNRISTATREKWELLSKFHEVLNTINVRIPYPEFRFATLRDIALQITGIINGITKQRIIPQEIAKRVRSDAKELSRICNLISLIQARDNVIAMDHQVSALREYVTSDSREVEPQEITPVITIIRKSIKNMEEFAHNQGIEFRVKEKCPNVRVYVIEREIVRAITNLIHNAIKYSWRRPRGEIPWIAISAYCNDTQVIIDIENYGVPIPQEELDKDLLFQIGYRGRLAHDRGRLGTGVGLTDSLRIAKKHGGNLTIKSRPVALTGDPRDYTKPFITTASLILPQHIAEGKP